MFDKLKKLFSQSSKANTDGTTFIRAAKPSEAKEAGGTRVREDAPQGHTVVKPVQAIAFSGRVARERLQEVFGDEFYVCDMLEGGMGHVYIGYCMRTGRYQAAKTFKDLCFQNPDGTIDKEIVQRFTRESVAWLSLGEHPNIVRADTLFEFQGKPYLFLELVAGHEGHGPTLKDWLAETKENIPLMLDYAIQCCEGMAYAAEKAGIVHRDLKPSNILVAEGGIAKITDFGLVKILTEPGGKQPERASGTYSLGRLAGLTLAGSTFGTPYYMPPEQWAAPERVDQRSDIYSFGAVMYAMLTGRPPFIIPDNLSSAHPGLQEEYLKDAHTSKEPEAIGGLNKKVDPELCRIVRQCLQKMPDDRPRSFRELKELLAECYKKLTGRSFCMPEPTVSYWDIVIAGKKKLESGSFEEAIPYFENVLRNDKRIFHAMQPLAQCCMMLKEFDKARSYLEQCLELCPYFAGAMNDMGFLYHLQKDEELAITWYEKGIALDASMDILWNNLGLSYMERGEFDKALPALDRALDLEPCNADALQNKADVYARLGDARNSAIFYRNCLIVKPGNIGVLHALMMQLLEMGAYGAAERIAETLEGAFPGNRATPVVFDAVAKMESAGCEDIPFELSAIDFEAPLLQVPAAKVVDNRSFGESADYELLRVTGWIEIGEYEKAVGAALQKLEKEPCNAVALTLLAMALYYLKDYKKGMECARQAIAADTEAFSAWRVRALCCQKAGFLDEAFEYISKAIQIRANSMKSGLESDYNNRGNILHQMGRYDEALASYTSALDEDPNYYLALENKAVCLCDMGRQDEALPLVEKALGIQHRSASGWRIRGKILREQGMHEEAERSDRIVAELKD